MFALKSIWDHPYTFWALLSLPAIPMIVGLASGDTRTIHQLLHPSGEFSARFMIITMMITPLTMLLKGQAWFALVDETPSVSCRCCLRLRAVTHGTLLARHRHCCTFWW